MNFFSKLVIVILSVLLIMYIKDKFVPATDIPSYNNKVKTENITTKTTTQVKQTTSAVSENLVAIYYTNANNGELEKVIKTVPPESNKLNFALKELVNGPSFKERNQGLSSEIPKGTKILNIITRDKSIIIDLSNEFQYGGGTESQYTRLNQLIKTVVNLKLNKPVYLYLNGEQADVIGGEGILINQPLNEYSINE
ncbi:GerMN domain-containing protein [bacterium]|nr:GerMN domain-containing protein [bacterium]